MRGGSLGGARASSFFTDSRLLDALAAVPLGGVSRVVETSHGFHILYKRRPPRDERVSGSRIVIGHGSALALTRFSGTKPDRSRADALGLARRAIAESKAGAVSFQALVEKYSEHPDRVAGGDIGSWSTLDSAIHEREIEVLGRLKVGEVSDPVESRWGVEVLQRTAERVRAEYSARVLRFDFEPAEPVTRAAAQTAANDAARMLAGDPQMFDELSRRQGSDDTRRWFEGREESALSAAVGSLAIGQVGTPVVLSRAIVIPQRVALDSPAAHANVQYEMPAPDGLALNLMTRVATPQHILEELKAVRLARAGAGWTNTQEGQLTILVDRFTKDPELPADATFATELEALVGLPGAPYRRLLEARFGDLLMNAKPGDLVR